VLNIPPLPPPQLTATTAWGLAGLLVLLGGLLLLWGRVLSRPFLSALGAAAGTILAGSLARQFGLPIVVADVVAILGLAVLGAVTARILWALAGGAFFGLAALGILLSRLLETLPPTSQPAFAEGTAGDLQGWFAACGRFLMDGVGSVWPDHYATVLWTICLGGGVPLVMLLLLPRLGKIFMTALIGAVGIVGGLMLAVSRLDGLAWPATWSGYMIHAGGCVVLLTFSLVFQYCGVVAAQRAEKEKKAKAAEAEEKAAKKSVPPGQKDRTKR
jgi:hypothetical protein